MLLVKSLWTVIFHFIKGKLSNICIGCSSTTFNTDIDFFYSSKLLFDHYFSPEKCMVVSLYIRAHQHA